jgi:hypothetical protein
MIDARRTAWLHETEIFSMPREPQKSKRSFMMPAERSSISRRRLSVV